MHVENNNIINMHVLEHYNYVIVSEFSAVFDKGYCHSNSGILDNSNFNTALQSVICQCYTQNTFNVCQV